MISTSTSWDGYALESLYLGSDDVGYRGTHLVLGRAGHRFLASTDFAGPGPTLWRERALLDHYAVLQRDLSDQLDEAVMIRIADD